MAQPSPQTARKSANDTAPIKTNAEAAEALRAAAADLDIAAEDTDRPATLVRAVIAYLET